MRVTVLLADYGQGQPNQKLNAIGLGWSRTITPLPAHSLVILLDLDPGEDLDVTTVGVRLVDGVGDAVKDLAGKDIALSVDLELRSDLIAAKPVPTVAPLVLGLSAGMELEPGVYTWEVTSPQVPDATWTRPFEVMEGPFTTEPPVEASVSA